MLNSSKKNQKSQSVSLTKGFFSKKLLPSSISNKNKKTSHSSQKPLSSKSAGRPARKTQPVKASLLNFAFDLSLSSDIPSFLLSLKSHLPKRSQSGEILLFYECELLGLRRAYLKKTGFHEESAKMKCPDIKTLRLSKTRENVYLTKELGRPFSNILIIPLFFHHSFLFIEWNSDLTEGIDFFKQSQTFLKLHFERIYQSYHLNREAYLWTQLFSHWKEPIAILQGTQVLKSNSSFKDIFLEKKEDIKKQSFSGSLKVKERTYQLFYHPLKENKALFYAQDMSKYFSLKEQLFQAEKMLDLFRLGQNMAHQLNNPLTGVRAMTQILSQSPRLKSFQKEFQELEKAIDRSHRIIQSFLSFSETGKEFKSCDLNQVIEDSLPLLKSMIKKVSLVKVLYKGELKVKGEFALFQQIIYNLILNACQALLEDEENLKPQLKILTDKISEDQVRMRIIDNGTGIPKENLDKIFRPLWTSRKNGTGFGLGITKKIVKKCGGSISVISEEGKQTCFIVSLPLYCPETLLEIIDSS